MHRTLRSSLCAIAVAALIPLSACTSDAAPAGTHSASPSATTVDAPAVTPPNGTAFTDVYGSTIHAHGGGVLLHDGVYYWAGENRGVDDKFRAVSLYRSDDLVHWTFVSDILTQHSDPELAVATIERPKLMYNAATDTFVLWMHWENGTDYSQARVAVATSPRIDEPFTYQRSFRPLDFESRDLSVFTDADGTGYLVSATAANADLQIYRMDATYTGVDSVVARLWPGAFREAPAMFVRDGTYFLLTSGATGWTPNQAKYATATSPDGPWSDLRDVGNDTAFGSQAAFVLPVQGSSGTDYLYLGDRWAGAWGGLVNQSTYVWLDIEFPRSDEMTLVLSEALRIDARRGTIIPTDAGGRR